MEQLPKTGAPLIIVPGLLFPFLAAEMITRGNELLGDDDTR